MHPLLHQLLDSQPTPSEFNSELDLFARSTISNAWISESALAALSRKPLPTLHEDDDDEESEEEASDGEYDVRTSSRSSPRYKLMQITHSPRRTTTSSSFPNDWGPLSLRSRNVSRESRALELSSRLVNPPSQLSCSSPSHSNSKAKCWQIPLFLPRKQATIHAERRHCRASSHPRASERRPSSRAKGTSSVVRSSSPLDLGASCATLSSVFGPSERKKAVDERVDVSPDVSNRMRVVKPRHHPGLLISIPFPQHEREK